MPNQPLSPEPNSRSPCGLGPERRAATCLINNPVAEGLTSRWPGTGETPGPLSVAVTEQKLWLRFQRERERVWVESWLCKDELQ